MQLHPFQETAVKAGLSHFKTGNKKGVHVLPTGSGKTLIAARTAAKLQSGRILVTSSRANLAEQLKKAFLHVLKGDEVGVIGAANHQPARVDICTAQYMGMNYETFSPDHYRLIIVDECHHAAARSYQRWLKHFRAGQKGGACLLGLTATYDRMIEHEKLVLADTFGPILTNITFDQLIEQGYLAKPKLKTFRTSVSLDREASGASDYELSALARVVNVEARNTGVAKMTLKHGANRKGIVFCVDIAHAQAMASALEDTGLKASAIHGSMRDHDKSELLHRHHSGEIQFLCSADLLTEGYDDSSIDLIVLARPTRSSILYQQMVGRGCRLHPGKEDCLVLDFVDANAVGFTDPESLPLVLQPEKKTRAGNDVESREDGQMPDLTNYEQYLTADIKEITSNVNVIEQHRRTSNAMQWIQQDHVYVAPLGKYQDAVFNTEKSPGSLHLPDNPVIRTESLVEATEIVCNWLYHQGGMERLQQVEGLKKWGQWPASDSQMRYLDFLGIGYSQRIQMNEAHAMIHSALTLG